MPTEVYKGHTLISIANYNTDTHCWVPHVIISWREGNSSHFHALDGPANLYRTQGDAGSHGLMLARAWVDQKL
jgi:hypothetical protein